MNPAPVENLLSLVEAELAPLRATLKQYHQNELRKAGLAACQEENHSRACPPLWPLNHVLNAEAYVLFEAEDFANRPASAAGLDEDSGKRAPRPGDHAALSLWMEFLALRRIASKETLRRWLASRTLMQLLALRGMLESSSEVFGDLVKGGIKTAAPSKPLIDLAL